MWTNVFKIGGLHQVSWFQLLPNESDPILSDRSLKSNQKDTGAQLVISSHLQLQKDGFLSTWGNSFVGPWDPSQGLHNPDEKIKLWLFIPGRHSSVVDKAKAAVSKLRVFASGLWLAPGDSEEVAAALSQALRNCIERALMGLSYVRFGDVFSRYHSSSQGEELFRRGQPVLEFIFTATEEAVFVHVIISAKHVRALTNGDMETILKRTSSHSGVKLPVIVAPHGMRGRITGICPGDLVKQLYISSGKFKAINGIVGLPNQFSQSSGCQLRGQNCYIEVTLGCENAESEKSLPPNSNTSSKNHVSESSSVAKENEKTFIYPAEAVLVPLVQTSSARSSLKRFWLQNWMGQSLSSSSFSMQCDAFGTMDGSWHDNDMQTQHGYNSSGNSNSSSISTSSSSDSDYRMTGETGDLEADADSLSCMKSGLTTADQMHIDGSKLGSKRSRTGMTESYGQAGAIGNASMQEGYNSMEINNDQGGSQWDWDDDDKGVVMDIQALLSEFGDFGDFFENDVLPFGEPPGTEESQTPMFSATDGGDKETIPVRIAGDLDSGLLDGPLNPPVGVWRTVGVTKGSKSMTQGMEPFGSLPHNSFNEEGMLSYGQRQPLFELLDGLPLLFQQATSFVDVTLDADCGDGPYGWLAMQEQLRRGFSCGPSLVHAGCGGVLSSCHALDIAGVELADPLSADVHASYAITLLQSDIKSALKSAFGTFDGPLTVSDWCKGRNGQTDVFSAESSASINDSSVEPISPSQSADGTRVDDISESEQQLGLRPALLVIPIPAILVGYQDDWLKTSATSLQHWEKAPFEPYAMQKHMNYCVICPDIDPLTTAAADFFQQLETVYETCKLGTHSPQNFGNQTAKDSGKWSSSGFVLLDCPQSMKIESDSASLVGSISDYFLSLSNGWDLTSFLKSLSKVLKALKLGSCFAPNSKEGNSTPCTVIYVVCPFPEPVAVLKTIVESCVAIGSVVFPSSDKERRTAMQNQVGKALSCSTAVDEASISNVVTISGFSIPKLVLQIVTVDAIFRVTSPSLNEPVILKEIAFTVYNKARRISRGSSADVIPSVSVSGRSQSHSSMMQMNSPVPGMWKDSIGSRMGSREGELDASLRAGVWDNSWQMSRSDRPGEYYFQDELKYMFEPLFILAEPGSSERGVSPESLKLLTDDGTSSDTGLGSQMDGSDDGFGSGHQKQPPSLHCCYGWTEDWRWLVCIWTDSRGELLDSCTFPFGGISSRQDTKGLQFLFVQILQQGCQILQACSSDTNTARPHDFVITRIGSFFELECQEWQKALYSIGGSEVKKWSLQLRRSVPDGIAASSNGGPLQQQEMSMIQDRSLQSHGKGSNYMKGGLGQPMSRKQLLSGGSGGSHIAMDNSKGLLQWVQSITFVSVSVDHSLQLVYQADSSPGTTQGSGIMGQSCYVEGFTPVKSLGSASTSYIFVPSPSMRFLPPNPLQLPTCLTSESQPLAHLLHSKGSAIPISTGFVVSKAVPSMRKDSRSNCKEEWPSVLSVGLFDYYGGNSNNNNNNGSNNNNNNEKAKNIGKSGMENHLILERVAAELHALSWMTVSPGYLERRTALPFHCDMVLRLTRLLHFADKELSQLSVKSEV
ncbi:putative mediator complex subunit Med13, mediator complex, subunit Med13, MID domain of medPIWI [Helianthus annuus]|nr:putative mediator complex subunit Med13, mediator complex, subunit Med13, MID domain of medPIWI [Helianthus annuus]KAJ0497918.1 putative mediator complex subunit Med13, mediator complex, subunit Med13, MID domain of medPIWI [Helianthus annuus]KAJ0663925.1 putative mediator complex subunit Med13, mediator complex, subunit Med13, MID domain of medPIWI [Helianthus annuus]KAJ0671412.1 putative mediator complex subunit Med13, mediator complex, subunit Med13, MID domain of medPIWI [Helianthus annuu